MEWSRSFKAVWWFILVVTIGTYLAIRFPEFKLGKAATPDVVVFLVWIAVCLHRKRTGVEMFFGAYQQGKQNNETAGIIDSGTFSYLSLR